MNVLKLFGIVRINGKAVATAIGTLLWFGVATNGLYDFWKLLPTASINASPDWVTILLDLFPAVSFLAWIIYIYRKLSAIVDQPLSRLGSVRVVSPHKGIVLALSKPRKSQDEIIELITNISAGDIAVLYNEQSIGQLFKGIYFHKELLKHVWLITTKDSSPYKACIESFLNKFVPSARICGMEAGRSVCHIPEGGDLELIEKTKAIVANIYSEEYLQDLGLERSDIIVDITGGTKSITIGLIFGALDSAIDIQYVEQQSGRHEVIPLAITPEMILDKAGEYLIQLYSKIQEKRGGV